LLNKYIKCNIWRLAVRYDIYIYIYVIRRLKVKISNGFPALENLNDSEDRNRAWEYIKENIKTPAKEIL